MQRTRLSLIFLFAAMVYVFLTLNAMYIQFSFFKYLRWIIPGLLIIIRFLEGRIAPPFMTLCLLALGIAPSVILSPNITTSGEKFISIILVIYACYDFFYNMDYEKDFNNAVIVLSVFSIVFLALNLVFITRSDSGRVLGILTNANTLGVYSNIALAFGIYCFYKIQLSRFTYLKWLFVLVCAVSVLLVILSESRSAFAAALVIVVVWVFIAFNSKALRTCIVIIVAIMMIVLFTADFSNSSIEVLRRFAESGFNRGETWENGIRAFKTSPIFGVGFQMSYLYNEVEAGFFMILHNSYLSFLADCGLWGVVIFGIPFIMSLVYFGYNLITKKVKITTELVFMLLVLVALLIEGYGESFLLSLGSTEGFIFWCVYAWVMAYVKRSRYSRLKTDELNVEFYDLKRKK